VKTTLKVEGTARGARVLVDGREVGRLPTVDMEVSSGKRRVRVEMPGFEAYERVVEVVSGRSVSLFVDLSPARPVKARLYVDTEPRDARVRIMNIVPAFHQGMELDAGSYDLEISAPGHESKRFDVSLSSGEDRKLSIRLDPVSAPPPVVSRPPESTAAGRGFKNSVGMDFVWIPDGEYMRGSPGNEPGRGSDEGPQHRVILTRGFHMQTTEVTQGQWRSVMGNNPSGFQSGDDYPVENVSWNDVQAFIRKLNGMESGVSYRLPTEAEWEYAARAGSRTRFYFGDDEGRLKDYAWYDANSSLRTQPVGRKKPNAWGLYDMHGNVWEWCSDWFGSYPSG
jgi:formylglycine-generating enzyme required for sulfatase activity